MPFRENLRTTILDPDGSPAFLRGYYGARLQYIWAAAQDHFLQYLWDGIDQSTPTWAETNSMRQIAADRRIPIYQTEPIPSQQKRLREWLDAHRAAGTDTGLLTQSQPYWLPEAPKMRVVWGNSTRAEWSTLNEDGSLEFHRADPSNWDWDSAYPFQIEPQTIHRGWLIVYAPASVLSHPITVAPSETISVGSTLLAQACQDVYDIGMLNHRTGARLWGWILAFDPASFDPAGSGAGYPDGTWYRSYKMDGSFNRLDTARYHVVTAWTP